MGAKHCTGAPALPGQVVLVLQGGGALGAYQAGVYQALHEAGIEPDWVIGTSIGAINGAIIAGSPQERRLERLRAFWERVQHRGAIDMPLFSPGVGSLWANFSALAWGIPSFFMPRLPHWGGIHAPVGIESAAYYSTEPLRETLSGLIDVAAMNNGRARLTLGAVNVTSSTMRYFDSREERLDIGHVMASGALPPAFPAIRIEGKPYWDGGVYSNTPIEAVFDDTPRRDSVIFAVNVWQSIGAEPESIWQVMSRLKEIQYASRADSHIDRQKQIHRLRHVIRELARRLPREELERPEVRELASWGCGTVMHVVRLLAPRLEGEDHMKDIDFTPAGISARWQAGYADLRRMIERRPWEAGIDPIEGVVVHQ